MNTNGTWYVDPQIFAVECQQGRFTHVLFAPKQKVVLPVNLAVLTLLRHVRTTGRLPDDELCGPTVTVLKEHRIITDAPTPPLSTRIAALPFTSFHVQLLPTSDCNLKCTYCYSNGGETQIHLDEEVALRAIDFAIDCAAENRKASANRTQLLFHGGGEPLLPAVMPLVQAATTYGRERASDRGLSFRTDVSTNGVFGPKTLDWVINNVDWLQISFDGPEDIQNLQRPSISGGKTFNTVMENCRALDRAKRKYTIRPTITAYSVSRMTEILQFLHSETQAEQVQFEPASVAGRSRNAASAFARPPTAVSYAENLIKTIEVADRIGARIGYGDGCATRLQTRHCGGAGTNFIVTPEGNVTTCMEMSSTAVSGHELFHIGRFDRSLARFVFDDERIKRLRSRTVENLTGCQRCHAQFSCAGYCLAAAYNSTGDLFRPHGTDRCKVIRAIGMYELKKMAMEGTL